MICMTIKLLGKQSNKQWLLLTDGKGSSKDLDDQEESEAA
jgi:hypothetical protein